MKHILFCLIALMLPGLANAASQKDPDVVAKHVRNFIKKGNEAYRNGQYDVAETFYRDALQENPSSDLAQFNLALSLLRQQTADEQAADTLRNMSKTYFQNVAGSSTDASLIEKAYYNLGNISFGEKDYATSIEMYKEALRRNPSNVKARQNLRVAQIKLKEQQNNQGQDNKDQQQNKDQKDQNKDQQQQQNQNQNQQQNQQNQQDKDKKEQGQPEQNKNKQEPPKEKSDNGGAGRRPEISKENAEKILKAAAKQEEQTRKRVEKNQKEQSTNRRIIGNPW